MMRDDVWSILGIEPTSNQRAIKRAYAKQSQLYHPEDYPEEFKELQAAYQKALEWSRSLTEKELEVSTYTSQSNVEDLKEMPLIPSLEEQDREIGRSFLYPNGQETTDKIVLEEYQVVLEEEETKETGGGVFRSSERTLTDEEKEFLERTRQQLSVNFKAIDLENVLKQALRKGYLSDPLMRQQLEELLDTCLYDNSNANIASLVSVYEQYRFTKFSRSMQAELERRGYNPLSEQEGQQTEKKSFWNYFGFILAVIFVIRIVATTNTISHQTSGVIVGNQATIESVTPGLSSQKDVVLSDYYLLPELTEANEELQHLDNMDWTVPLIQKKDQVYSLYIEKEDEWLPFEAVEEIYIVVAEEPSKAYYVIMLRKGETWTVYNHSGVQMGEVELTDSSPEVAGTTILTYDGNGQVFHMKGE